ncbi:AAA ATPase midasin, partial [Coemansia nantahalensis]
LLAVDGVCSAAPTRVLLAALGAVAPEPSASGQLMLAAMVGADSLATRLAASGLVEPIGRARALLAQASGVDCAVLAAAPACLALNGGVAGALAPYADHPAAKWHAVLLDALRFQRERAAAEELWQADDGAVREHVLQRPGVDVLHAQACFAVVDGCAALVAAWEAHAAAGEAGEAAPALGDVRVVFRLQARLQRLLAREPAAPSEEAVALEGIQAAAARLVATSVGAHAEQLAVAVAPLVLDASRSAQVWALCHPATLAADQARALESQLAAALDSRALSPETRAAAVEAQALLYAAGARRHGERIVEAVARFVAQSLPPAQTARTAPPAPAPADVLADVAQLAAWRGAIQLTALAGCLPDESEQRRQALSVLGEWAARTAGEQWPVQRLRLSWAAHGSASRAELMSLFVDMAFAWCGAVRNEETLGALVAEPAHRLSRAVATELAWRGAAHIQSPLAEHDRRAAESRALCRAATRFRAPAPPAAAQLSMSASLLLAVVAACDVVGADLAAASEQLVTQLAEATAYGSWVATPTLAAAAWLRALSQSPESEAADALAPAAVAVHSALAEPAADLRAELACVALAEAAVCLLGASVPARPVDPAAKAHTQWAWLGEDAAEASADADAHAAVHRSMAGAPSRGAMAAAAEPFAAAARELQSQRERIALVHRPADARFGELWREAHTLAATLGPRMRDIARRLREAGDASALDAARAAEQALRTTLAQFEHRVAARHFGALRDIAQIWCLCARLVAHALAQLAELCRRRQMQRAPLAHHARLVQQLYAQPMCVGVLASPASNAHMRQTLDQVKVLIYTTPGASPAAPYAELVGAVLARAVVGVQVRGTLGAAELDALDAVFSDACVTHRRAADEKRRRDAEAASLFRHRGPAEPTEDQFLREVFPAYDDVLAEPASDDAEDPASGDAPEPGFQDVSAEAVAAIAACHRYVMLRFGVVVPAPDVQSALIVSSQQRALQLAATLHRLRPELPALLGPDADDELRGANTVAAAAVAAAAAAKDPSGDYYAGEWAGVRAEHVYDFYRGAAPHETVLAKPVAAAIAARAQELLGEWPDHAVLQRIRDMAGRVLQLPVTAPLAQLLTAVEQLHAQAQDWEAYASRDVSIAELQQAARLIVRWRQAELNSWPHLLRAQELQCARRADEWWFGLYAALVAPESAALADLVAAVDQFMQGSPAGEFRARLNMLCAFRAHRAAALAAAGRSGPDAVLGPLTNAVDYYAQYAPCIAAQLDAARAAIAKDLSQYVRISSWTDVNPAALRASAEKTHRHLARCVRRWRDALAQPIFQIVQAQRAAAVAAPASVPRVPQVSLPLGGAGLDVATAPPQLAAPTALPWAAAGLEVDAAAARQAAQRATSAGVPRVLEASAATLARLGQLVQASAVLGLDAAPLAASLERFAEDIVGDIAHFQTMEAPKHLVKRAAASAEAPAPKAKRVIKARQGRAQEPEPPAYVDDDEERQRLLKRFWGEQRNLRRARLTDILRALQEIGLKRRHIAADSGEAAGGAAELTGLAGAMGRRPLDVAAWEDALAVVARASPGALHQSAPAMCGGWRQANAAFFHLTARLAQLRTAAHEEHSQELSAQQTAAVVALVESLGRHVAADREAAAGLLAAAAACIQAALPWTTLPADEAAAADGDVSQAPAGLDAACAAVEQLVALLEQCFVAVRAVRDAEGWGDSAAPVAQAMLPLEQAAPQVARARTMLADARAAHVAALLAGAAPADAAALLAVAPTERAALQETRAALATVHGALKLAAESGLDQGLLSPWLQPIQQAADAASSAVAASGGADTVGDEAPDAATAEAADLAGQWVTAVMNVWQAVAGAERQFTDAIAGDENAWGLVPKELLHRMALAQQLARALQLPTMLALCHRLSRAAAAAGLCRRPEWRALATRVVRPWVVQYTLLVQHVVALYAGFHRSLTQFALTVATGLTSAVVHGLGASDSPETEEVDGGTQSGMGVGEGSTAGAKNVSDEIEGEDQVEGLQGDQDPGDNNDPATNEDAVEMSTDFDGKMGDADLQTDDEDSDDESSDDEDDHDEDEKLGDVDPTDPTSLDDKLWDDKDDAAQEEKEEDSKVDGKAQSKKEESDIVAGDDNDNKDDGSNNDPGEKGAEDEATDEEMSDGSGSEDGDDGDLDDSVNKDTLDRMAEAEDVGEQMEMPEDMDMGGDDDGEESMTDDDDGIDADMGELSDDEPIERKPDGKDDDEETAPDEADAERADNDARGDDSGEDDDAGDGEGSDVDSAAAESGDEAEAAGDEDSDAGESDAEDPERALGEDAPEEAKEHSGADKPTHGVDSAMNMDGAEDVAPDTAADDSRDALEKPSDSADARRQQQQLPRQGAAEQSAAVQQDPEQQPQQPPQQSDAEQRPPPERTLADVIEKWERRLNIVMRDADVDDADEDGTGEQADNDDAGPSAEAAAAEAEEAKPEPAPEATEFEHVGPDEDYDKVALADADEQDRREFQPMDIDAEEPQKPQQQPIDDDVSPRDKEPAAESQAPVPNPQQRQPLGDSSDVASAAQMQQAREELNDAMDLASDDGRAEAAADPGPGGDGSDADEDAAEEPPVDVEQLRAELELATAAWRADSQGSGRAMELWQAYTRLTHELSLMLTEQLRLILTPTQATQLRGDYRTGKRLNMKRIIPYIASEFRKDKIWLRRTKPARREYQVMIALDNSKSMAQTPQAVELAYETLALVTTALNQLEVGQLSVVSFGEQVSLLHPFEAAFDAEAGAHVLSRFTFADDKTDVVQLMDASLRLFEASAAAADEDLWRLQLVISDGVCQDHPRLLRQVRAATEQRIMTVFIVLDRSAIAPAAAAASGASDPDKDSIMNTQHVSFATGPDGRMEMKVARYLDTFPFKYYVVLRDIHGLPAVLAETLRQYYSLVG